VHKEDVAGLNDIRVAGVKHWPIQTEITDIFESVIVRDRSRKLNSLCLLKTPVLESRKRSAKRR